MTPFKARDALSPHAIKTSLSAQPSQLWEERKVDAIYAVFQDVPSGAEPLLLGLVTDQVISLFPGRSFAELLPPYPVKGVSQDLPVDDVVQQLEVEAVEALPVHDERGQFAGVVSRGSLVALLLRHLRRLLASPGESGGLPPTGAPESGAPPGSGAPGGGTPLSSSFLPVLRDVQETLHNLHRLLGGTPLDMLCLQQAVDVLHELTGAPFVALFLFNDRGQVSCTLTRGIADADAERLALYYKDQRALLRGSQAARIELPTAPPFTLARADQPAMPLSGLFAQPIASSRHIHGAALLGMPSTAASIAAHDELLLALFANVLALCLQNAREAIHRHKLENQLRQSQKMEAIGRLAGGVAHDFNNLLTIIIGYSELMLATPEPADDLHDNLGEIKKAAEQATQLTRQLLAFSRRQIVQPRVLDLNATIADMEKMLRRLLGEDIEMIVLFESSLLPIKADPGQIQQILLNLAVNARDAMPDGGKLILETYHQTITAAAPRPFLDMPDGAYAVLSVSDTGQGMSEETKAHLFEPFYTTKEQGKGTGLGLATVYGAVSQAGGFIEVVSEPGQGATFKIYVPQVDPTGALPRLPVPPKESQPSHETVLLVEDENALRALTRHILQRNGFQVLEAKDGMEAIKLCEQYAGPVHLLVTDLVLPQLNGRQLADRIMHTRPATKLLFVSGYEEEVLARTGLSKDSAIFLQKPFTPESLVKKVREILSSN